MQQTIPAGTRSLVERLFAAQEKIGVLTKDKENPHFHSKHTDINAIIEIVKPIMHEEGLLLLQPLTNVNGRPAIKTIISFGGETLEEVMTLPDLQDPQKMGSAITYYRRYALQSLLFIQAEDDDGNEAAPAKTQKKASAKKPAPVENTKQEPTVRDNKFRVDEENKPEEEIPTCSICQKPMKPTKGGTGTGFFCKHGDRWGQPVYSKKAGEA